MPTAAVLTPIAISSRPVFGSVTPQYTMQATVNLGDPYAAGGIEFLPATVTARILAVLSATITCTTIQQVICASACQDGTHYMVWDAATNKMLAYVHATGAEAGAVDLTAAGKVSACTFVFV